MTPSEEIRNTGAVNIPEGDRYLLVRLSKDNQLAVVFSDPIDAMALSRIGDEWINQNITIPSTRPQQPAAVQIPQGLDVGSIVRRIRK